MRYVKARESEYQREQAYRFYITDSLMYAGENKYITVRYADIITPKKHDTRSGDEIAAYIINKLKESDG